MQQWVVIYKDSLTQEEKKKKKQLKEGVDGPVSNQPWLSSLNESHTT